MNFRFLLVLAVLVFSSCSTGKEEKTDVANFSADDFPTKWELAEMSTMLVGSYTSGEDLPYRETYLFKEDGTFVKTRLEEDNALEASGEYSIVTMNDGNYYKLDYNSPDDLVENCSSSDTEYLKMESSEKITGTANACDYPSKAYKRVK